MSFVLRGLFPSMEYVGAVTLTTRDKNCTARDIIIEKSI